MMHSIKRESPLKHDLKLGVSKSFSIKTSDGDNIGVGVKNLKSQNSQQASSSSKLNCKVGNPKSKSPVKQEMQPKSSTKKLTKRKEDTVDLNTVKKKAKCDLDAEIKSKNSNDYKLQSKKQCKSRSIYSKDNASFVCKFCCRRFRSVELLKEHSLSHGDKPEYICHICNHEAACFSALMTHVVKHSRKSNKETMSNQTSNNFLIPEKPKQPFHCSQCKSSFPSSQKLSCHTCPIKKSEYLCAYCGQVSTSVEEYRCHVQSHSVTPFMCNHCTQKLPTKKHLDKHFEFCKKRPKAKFKCDKCSFTCKGKRELNQHLKLCNLKQESSTLNCTQCQSNFSNKTDLTMHLLNCKTNIQCNKISQAKRENEIKDSLLCSLCNRRFDNDVNYEKHKQQCSETIQQDVNERTSVLCPFCGDLFHSLHLVEHKKACCSQQNKDLSTVQNKDKTSKQSNLEDSPNTRRSARLVRKKSIVSSEEETKKNDLPKPKRIRKLKILKKFKGRKGRQSKLGKENFMCGECSLTFCSKSTLLRHKRMHSGNPWYSCQYCGKYFFRKDVFNRHEMNVHSKSSKNVFCCYYCKLFFNAASLLKEHVAANHKENSVFHVKTRITVENNMREENDSCIQIKQEVASNENINETKTNQTIVTGTNSPKGVNSTSSSYMISPYKKCGICYQTFETNFAIEEHLLSHPLPEKHESSECDANVTNACEVKEIVSSNITSMSLSSDNQPSTVVSLNDEIRSSLISPKHHKRLKTVTHCKALNEIAQPSQENALVTFLTHSETEDYLCKLCLKTFNNRKAFSEHETQSHIMLDWYQCLVCDASGTKKDMQEHMFLHMYKVGTFVVANNYNGVNDILPCLQPCGVKPNECKNFPTANIEENNESEVAQLSEFNAVDIELPKLKYCGCSSPVLQELPSSNISSPFVNVDSASLNQEIETSPAAEIISSEYSSNLNIVDITISNKDISEETTSIPTKVISEETIVMPSKTTSEETTVIPKKIVSVVTTIMPNKTTSEETTVIPIEDTPEEDTLSKYNLEKNTSDILDNGAAYNDSTELNKNSIKDPFQELRRILKEDNIPLNEGNGSFIPSKVQTSLETKTLENQNHSQLRYLLEKSNKNHLHNKTDSFNQCCENAKEFDTSKNEQEQTSDVISSMKNLIQDLKSLNKLVSESAPDPDISEELNLKTLPETDKTSSVGTKPSFHTCLKFDVNQSRGEYSETSNVSKLEQNPFEFHKMDKVSNIFQPTNTQSTILDFSDLLKIGDSIGASDNSIFGCTSQSSGLFDLHSSVQDVNPVDRDRDSTISCGFGSNLLSTDMLKCNNCGETFKEYSDLIKHSCSKTTSLAEQSTEHKSEANFSLPFDLTKPFIESDGKPAKNKHTTFENSIHKPENVFSCCICSKAQKSHFKLEQHYHSDHNCFTSNSSSNKCIRCYGTFYTVGDFMKHSLNCLKSNWYSNNNLQDGLRYQGVLQSLLSKPESQISQNCSDITSDNADNDFSYDDILNLSRNSFNS